MAVLKVLLIELKASRKRSLDMMKKYIAKQLHVETKYKELKYASMLFICLV